MRRAAEHHRGSFEIYEMSRARDGCDLLTAMQIDIVLRIRTLHSKRRDAEIHVTNVCTLRYIVRHVPNCSRRIDSPYIISISYQLSAGNEPNFAPNNECWNNESGKFYFVRLTHTVTAMMKFGCVWKTKTTFRFFRFVFT